MPTSTRKNGITLIALIITIIVMLILVGVTINVALNGGLFDKAKTASDGTQKEVDREALISAVIGTLNDDGTVNLTELQANLPDDFEYSNGIYTNTKNGKQYTVDSETGKVEQYTTNSGNGGGQVTYLDYNASPLPKFTFNDNPDDLADLLDPTINTNLASIVELEEEHGDYYSSCDAELYMLNEGERYVLQLEVCYGITGDQQGKYYMLITYANATNGTFSDYYYSLQDITVDGYSITGGVWNVVDNPEGDNPQAVVTTTYPIIEGIEIKDDEENVEPSKTNANTYYQHLFVVVED